MEGYRRDGRRDRMEGYRRDGRRDGMEVVETVYVEVCRYGGLSSSHRDGAVAIFMMIAS